MGGSLTNAAGSVDTNGIRLTGCLLSSPGGRHAKEQPLSRITPAGLASCTRTYTHHTRSAVGRAEPCCTAWLAGSGGACMQCRQIILTAYLALPKVAQGLISQHEPTRSPVLPKVPLCKWSTCIVRTPVACNQSQVRETAVNVPARAVPTFFTRKPSRSGLDILSYRHVSDKLTSLYISTALNFRPCSNVIHVRRIVCDLSQQS